jgi:hypothetical protein
MLTLTHPAYPTRNELSAEDSAIDRDLRDSTRLEAIHECIVHWLDELIPMMHPMEHPQARWQPGDLVEALREQDQSLAWERNRLTGPLFIEEDE